MHIVKRVTHRAVVYVPLDAPTMIALTVPDMWSTGRAEDHLLVQTTSTKTRLNIWILVVEEIPGHLPTKCRERYIIGPLLFWRN